MYDVPANFKIRKKLDVGYFLSVALHRGAILFLTDVHGRWYSVKKDMDGAIIISTRLDGNADYCSQDVIVSSTNSSYATVEDWFWKNRKAINHQLFC